jgi:hypothetical protein
MFFPTVEFQIRSWADLLDQSSKQEWFATVDCAAGELPAANSAVAEWKIASNAEQKIFV